MNYLPAAVYPAAVYPAAVLVLQGWWLCLGLEWWWWRLGETVLLLAPLDAGARPIPERALEKREEHR